MIKRLFGELPAWATIQHPLLRYELHRNRMELGSRARFVRIVSWVLLLTVLLLGGYIFATDGFRQAAGFNATQGIWRTLFFPALIIQMILRVAAISLGVGAVNDERQRQTWDNLRATEYGAELALRTRWVAVFYRLRGLLLSILAVRIVLLGAMLFELTSLRGAFLDILTGHSDPSVPLAAGVVLLAATLTAAFLLPLTGMSVDIAIGLWISSTIRQRAYAAILQVLVIALRIGVFLGLLYGASQFFSDQLDFGAVGNWFLLFGWSAFGDWGLTLLQLSQTGQDIWAVVPYSIFYGLGLLAMMLIQATIASGLLGLAVRTAERRE